MWIFLCDGDSHNYLSRVNGKLVLPDRAAIDGQPDLLPPQMRVSCFCEIWSELFPRGHRREALSLGPESVHRRRLRAETN